MALIHAQARALGLAGGGELAKLLQLREEAGELAAGDERRFRALSRATERELLQARAALPGFMEGYVCCLSLSPCRLATSASCVQFLDCQL